MDEKCGDGGKESKKRNKKRKKRSSQKDKTRRGYGRVRRERVGQLDSSKRVWGIVVGEKTGTHKRGKQGAAWWAGIRGEYSCRINNSPKVEMKKWRDNEGRVG